MHRFWKVPWLPIIDQASRAHCRGIVSVNEGEAASFVVTLWPNIANHSGRSTNDRLSWNDRLRHIRIRAFLALVVHFRCDVIIGRA
jgi:hypothetical protein